MIKLYTNLQGYDNNPDNYPEIIIDTIIEANTSNTAYLNFDRFTDACYDLADYRVEYKPPFVIILGWLTDQ